MSKTISVSAAGLSSVLGIALASVSAPASAGLKDAFKGSAQDQRKDAVAQIPVCAKPLGSLSVIEPEDAVNWWSGQQLPAPSS